MTDIAAADFVAIGIDETLTTDGPATTYDEVPNASYPYAQSSPDRLATVATLFGLKPAPVDHCRVKLFYQNSDAILLESPLPGFTTDAGNGPFVEYCRVDQSMGERTFTVKLKLVTFLFGADNLPRAED